MEWASRHQFSNSSVAQHANMYNQCLHDWDLLRNKMDGTVVETQFHSKDVFAVHTTTLPEFALKNTYVIACLHHVVFVD